MDIKFTIVEHAEENFELYVDHEPFSKYVEVPSDRISDQPSINSRKDIYLEFVSNDENGSFIHIDKQPRRSKSDKVNKISYEDKALKKTYSDSEVAKGVKGDVK
jgi:hypothetical protein